MFCVTCGKRLEAGMRYCPACGAVVEGAAGAATAGAGEAQRAGMGVPPPPWSGSGGAAREARTPVLLRPREGRVIAGVCAAFAQRYGWDVMVVRIVLGVVTLLTALAVGVAAYVVAWIVIPEAPNALPDASR